MSSIFDLETVTDFSAARGNRTFVHKQSLKSGKHHKKKVVSALKVLALSDNEER